jgi:hypothetical protein
MAIYNDYSNGCIITENEELYMIDVDDKDDFNELKKEYMKLKRS